MNPSIINAEEQVLNHLIADSSLYWEYCPRLKDEFFTEHTSKWEAYKDIITKGGQINLVSLNKASGGAQFEALTELTKKISYDVDFGTWVTFLEGEVKRQKGVKLLTQLNELITTNDIDKIEPLLHLALNDLSGSVIEHRNMIDHVKDIIAHIESMKSGKSITGFPTGIQSFDMFTGGLQLTDLTIIAAETSQGKTTFSLNIAYHNAVINNHVAIFSLEMSLRQLTARLLGIDTKIPSKDILSGKASLTQLNEKLGKIVNNKILLDNTKNSSLESIVSKMRYFISRFGCKLFFIDYLQLISYYKKGNSPEQNLADICRTLKNFAKENNVSVVLLCQLNRDSSGSTTPKLNRLRGSGQIEEAADNVMFITRPAPSQYGEPEQAKIFLSKGRNSGTGEFDLIFHGYIPEFTNI